MGWKVFPSKVYKGRYALNCWGEHSIDSNHIRIIDIVGYLRKLYPNDDMLYCTDPQESNEWEDYVCDAMITDEQRVLIELKFR